jgi:hypothetical protein
MTAANVADVLHGLAGLDYGWTPPLQQRLLEAAQQLLPSMQPACLALVASALVRRAVVPGQAWQQAWLRQLEGRLQASSLQVCGHGALGPLAGMGAWVLLRAREPGSSCGLCGYAAGPAGPAAWRG